MCDKCGLCCTQVGDSPIYRALDRGDGVCMYLDRAAKLCTIYECRPVLCNVDRAYSMYFAGEMSKEEYYVLNYGACKKLKGNAEGGNGSAGSSI